MCGLKGDPELKIAINDNFAIPRAQTDSFSTD